jgi:beta-mannosidase
MSSSPEPRRRPPTPRIRVNGEALRQLKDGWTATATTAGLWTDSTSVVEESRWTPAQVPGTAAGALRLAGRWSIDEEHSLDAEDWWFRTSFDSDPPAPDEELLLRFDGLATVTEVYLNGELVLTSSSMFATHTLDVSEILHERNDLAICCRALSPLLRVRRRPRARWRTRVADGGLRFFRTMLLGRAPGFAPGPAAVGPWRPITLERRRGLTVDQLTLRPCLRGADGVLEVRAHLRGLAGHAPESVEVELSGPSGTHCAPLALSTDSNRTVVEARGELLVADVARWWPHTHGDPVLHDVRLRVGAGEQMHTVEAGKVGFRTLSSGGNAAHEAERDGLDLHVNDVRVFARGAVWTPLDIVGLGASRAELRTALEQARDAGMNLLRIPGTSAYESSDFHDLCDELGLLLWQDFMFANFDYPIADETFREIVVREASELLQELVGRPSLAVLCGNSEVEQQVAMLGLDPSQGRGELFGELLPGLVSESGADAVYLPSAPCGGTLPFRPDRGVSNYYGVGGYRRPLEDARRAEVRFAAECLAFANVPDQQTLEEIAPDSPGGVAVHDPRWKRGVPRDIGSGWDFDDVRDHYLGLLFGVDPGELRRVDNDRYLELSRTLTGEVMAEVFGEWRRAKSPCNGGLVLWMRDLEAGAGWGVVDYRGRPKVAYHHLRRALAPVAVWITDEGLNGMIVHVANDGPAPLKARLRLGLYQDFEQRVGEAEEILALDPHETCERDLESLLGHFVDVSWAYRFGPAPHDLIMASLERSDEHEGRSELLSQTVRFPAGRPIARESAGRLRIEADVRQIADGALRLTVHSSRFAYGVRVLIPGFIPSDDAFSVEPGIPRMVTLRPRTSDSQFSTGTLGALNLEGQVRVLEHRAERA